MHPDENPALGLSAKDPGADVTVEEHVTNGSYGRDSQYISCSKSLDAILELASKSRNHPRRIVQINIDESYPEIEMIIDLTDWDTLNNEIPMYNEMGRKFANYYKEVLIVGYIPKRCITQMKIYEWVLICASKLLIYV